MSYFRSNTKQIIYAFLVLPILLSSCTPQVIETPTPTPIPSSTPTPTQTATPSTTPTPTSTFTPSPTPTLSPEELQALMPEGVNGEVIMGENGRPELQVEMQDYDVPDGRLVIGEYKDGQWSPFPFEFTRSSEATQEVLDMLPGYFVEKYATLPEGFVVQTFNGQFQGMRLGVDEETGETDITMLMISRGRVFKFSPSSISTQHTANGSDTELHDPSALSVENVANFIEYAEGQIPYGWNDGNHSTLFFAGSYVVTAKLTENFCEIFGLDGTGFINYCTGQIRNENRQIKTQQDFQELVSEYGFRLSEQSVAQGIDWWDDELIRIFPHEHTTWTHMIFIELE